MILRLTAGVSLCVGAAVLSLFLGELGKAPWSGAADRHLRRMKDRTGAPERIQPITWAEITSLPRRASLGQVAAIERRGAVLEGYIQRIERAPDDDIHLDFAPTLDPEERLVPYISAEISPQWHRGSSRWRYDRLAETFRPYVGGRTRWDTPPRRMRLRGWLMYDRPYEGAEPVFGFPPHLAVWEIHPLTGVEVWDEARAAFVEIPR